MRPDYKKTTNSSIGQGLLEYMKSTKILVNGLIVISFIFLTLGLVIGKKIYNGNIPDIYSEILLFFSILLLITSSIIVIVRRELPRAGNFQSITGTWALVWGIITLAVLLFAELYTITLIVDNISVK